MSDDLRLRHSLRAKCFVAWMFFRGWVRKALFLGEFVRFAVYACADASEIAVMRGEWKKILAVGERSLIWTSGVARKRRNACEMSLHFSVFFVIFIGMSNCASNYFYDSFPQPPGPMFKGWFLLDVRTTWTLDSGVGFRSLPILHIPHSQNEKTHALGWIFVAFIPAAPGTDFGNRTNLT